MARAGKRVAAAAVTLALSWSAAARAAEPAKPAVNGVSGAAAKRDLPLPPLPPGAFSDYEKSTMARALRRHDVTVDLAPEGKIIEDIAIEVLDVIEDRDPLPNFFNIFHCTSRQRAIRRELLFAKGERYEAAMIHETERALRSIRQQSLVIILPVTGSAPDRVRVLVIAKDVWSLRLNTGYRISGAGLEYLLVQPSEENLGGMHRSLSANFVYDPATISVGAGFIEPRLASSRVLVSADANAIINYRTREAEGSFGTVDYGVPLYSTKQKWAWGGTVAWRHETTRRFTGRSVTLFNPDPNPAADCSDPRRCIPIRYLSDIQSGSVSLTRSFGGDIKQDVTLGAGADRRAYLTEDLSAYDPAAAALFVDKRVPLSDTRNGPFLQYHVYWNRYTQLVDVETLGLQESFRLGPEAYARFYPIARFLGSKRDLLGHSLGASYTQAIPNGLVRLYASGGVEVKTDFGEIFNSAILGGLRIVSPRFFIGRLVYDGAVTYRFTNTQRTLVTLGGDGRLRGYRSGLFIGQHLLSSNLEFRSRPFQLWTFQLAGALFYDVGDAFDSLATLRPKQGAGFGLRLGFPQLERSVMRIDWGFPLTPGVPRTSIVDGLIITFGQAFGVPQLSATGVAR